MNYNRILKESNHYYDGYEFLHEVPAGRTDVKFKLRSLEATCKGRPIFVDTPRTTISVPSWHGEWDYDDVEIEKGMDNFDCNEMFFTDHDENGEYVEDCDISELSDEELYNIVKKLVEDGEYDTGDYYS